MGKRDLHDRYFRQAKDHGYAARSAFKLLQINERRKLIRKGDRVLDLGCSPGSWLQVAADLVGPKGLAVGIDLNPVRIALPAHCTALVGDIFKTPPAALLEPAARRYDTLLSDMAPSTSGTASDHFRSVELCDRVLELTADLLKPGGHLAMKVFEGEAYADLLKRTARVFDSAKGFKPDASRDVSREIYIVATGYQGPPDRTPADRAPAEIDA